MSYSSGEAAEQVVRMTLNGVEVAAKISGKAAERLAVLLYAVLKDQKKTRGKTRLNSMLRSGKELKVFAIGDRDLEKFCRENKPEVAVLCIPKSVTKEIVDRLTELGVRSFWNFSHYDINVEHKNIIVENVHLGDSLLTLSYGVNNNLDNDK